MITAKSRKEPYLKVFLTAFCISIAIMLPLLIYNKGIFLYYGDFNAQQLPFGTLLQRVIKSDGIGWSWGTDLGTSLLGSYSFYLIGSPFFWLCMLFPIGSYVYLLPWVLAIKFGIAALTAYAFIRRFTKTSDAAFIGAMLYAFSGFQLYNVFFNHFHDVTALFPLMLIAMEENIINRRKGVFALSVALMAVVNYFFFTGQAVFLVLYFIVRCFSKDFNITPRKFLGLFFEAVLGTGIAAFMLVPSIDMLLGNYRISEYLSGYDMIAYNDKLRIFRILQSFFMLPDAPARPNLFAADSAKWSSIAGYLPMFSMAGVIAFAQKRKKHWANILILVCFIMAIIPIFNSGFYMFNSSYYARWYYMPILIMAMMTAVAVDDPEIDMRSGLKVCFGALAFFAAVFFIPTKDADGWHFFKTAKYTAFFIAEIYLTAAMTIAAWILCTRKDRIFILGKIKKFTVASCVVSAAVVMYYGVSNGPYPQKYIGQAINGGKKISLEGDEFFRIDSVEGTDNYPMFWDYSSIRTFHSVVNPSIMYFYDNVGVQRDVASRPETSKYGLRGLLSVKYYFDAPDSEKKPMTGFEFYDNQNGFDVYENKYFIPMGFTYDYYITEEYIDSRSESIRDRLLVAAVLLNDEQIEKYSDILSAAPSEVSTKISDEHYLANCLRRAESSCTNLKTSADGFTAEISLDSDELVFFSVPFDKGFTAYVNGERAEIEQVNYGFMAVRVPAGDGNIIEFDYKTYGFNTGVVISIICTFILGVYIFICKKIYPNDYTGITSKGYFRGDQISIHTSYMRYLERYKGKAAITDKKSDSGEVTSENENL